MSLAMWMHTRSYISFFANNLVFIKLNYMSLIILLTVTINSSEPQRDVINVNTKHWFNSYVMQQRRGVDVA